MMYISEYLPKLASKLNLGHICDPHSNNNFEGEYPKGKGRLRKVKGNYSYFLRQNEYINKQWCNH